MENKKKNKTINILRVVISISLLILLIWIIRDNIGDVFKTLQNINLTWYIITFILNLIIMMFLSYRMKLVFSVSEVDLSFKEAVQLNFIGYFFNNFLPTSAGGDIVKVYLSSRISKKNIESAAATIMDRIIGIYSIFLVAGITVSCAYGKIENKVIAILIWVVFLLLTIALFLLPRVVDLLVKIISKWKKLIEYIPIDRLKQIVNLYLHNKQKTFLSLLISVFTKILSVLGVYFLSISLNLHISFITLLWVIPLVFALNMLPSINGLGIREGAFMFFFGGIIGNENAFALSIIWWSIYLLTDIVGGFILLFAKKLR